MAWPNAQMGKKKSIKGSEQRAYLKCSTHTHAGFVPASGPHCCTKEAQPLRAGDLRKDLRAGCRISQMWSPAHPPVLCLGQDCWEVWPGSAMPVLPSSPASPPWEEECGVLRPSQGPASLPPPLLNLPKPSPALLGAATSPTSSHTLLHPELPPSLPGPWSLPAPTEDNKGHDVTLSAHRPACHQLIAPFALRSAQAASWSLTRDTFAGGHETDPAFISPAQVSCSSLCVLQKTPAFAEMLCAPRCGVSGTHTLDQGLLGFPRGVWGPVTMVAQQKHCLPLPRMS